MEDYRRVSEIIVDTLSLEYSPVAVKFLSKTDPVPPLARKLERPLSGFCAGVEETAKGLNLHLQRKDVACVRAVDSRLCSRTPWNKQRGKNPNERH